MSATTYSLGLDISTQTVTVLLMGVRRSGADLEEVLLCEEWCASSRWAEEVHRKSPRVWVQLVRELIDELGRKCSLVQEVTAIGVSTAFPGNFVVLKDGSLDPRFVSLYDNTDDAVVCGGAYEDLLALAENCTLNRMWPGNMAVGLVHLVKTEGLDLENVLAVLPPNTVFSYALLQEAGAAVEATVLPTDFTQAVIGGLYDARVGAPLPKVVARLMEGCLARFDASRVRGLLPRAVPSWQNTVPSSALGNVRALLGLPSMRAVSVGAGDSPLGALALGADADTIINVRGSSDSPVLTVSEPEPKRGERETVLHYPMPTMASLSGSPWCVVAPILRSGKVWDWVRRLRFAGDDPEADAGLERLAGQALKRRLRCRVPPLRFDTALGGERAPDWDPHAAGRICGITEVHDIGDIALAALEGLSVRLAACIRQMESRYNVCPRKMVLAGGPARNDLWSWITGLFLGKEIYRGQFTQASALGAAMLGYAASVSSCANEEQVSRQLRELAILVHQHPAVRPVAVLPADEELRDLEVDYKRQIALLCGEL
ncbi:MAG: FGGY-family carbohydrate kinase [Armatimonadota bacterium]